MPKLSSRFLPMICAAPALLLAAVAHAAPLPNGANEWTTLYATFDKDTNAGTSQNAPYATGNYTSIVPGGVVGQALATQGRLANVLYDGRNIPGPVGTVRVWFKSAPGQNLWNDGREYFLAAAERNAPAWSAPPTELERLPGFHWLLYKNKANELVFGLDNTHGAAMRSEAGTIPTDPMPVSVRVPVASLAPDAWQEVAVSWDAPRHKYWLRVGDVLQAGTMPASFQPGKFDYLLLATHPSIYGDRQGHFPGLLDELLVSDRPLDAWLAPNAPKDARRLEAPAPEWPRSTAKVFKDEPWNTYEVQLRTYLDTQARMQNEAGGWNWSYHFPSGMHFLSDKTRTPLPPNQYNNAKDGTSSLAALRYLMAYEALGEPEYLAVAKRAADSVLKAQQTEGWWPYWWIVTDKGVTPYGKDSAPIEDHTQTGPIFLLMYLHRLTGEAKYLDAAKRGVEFLIKAQNANGSWSHHYNLVKKVGQSAWESKPGAGEFNDHTTTGPMTAMLLAYRLTGEQRFLDSYMRGVNWIMSAFIDNSATGGGVGWAQQYDADNTPIQARHFEPAALENFASNMAAGELLNAYRLTGNVKYLEPARKWLAWLQAKNGQYSFYHDIETGRPIVAENRKVYFLDDPAQVAAHKAEVEKTGRPYESTGVNFKDWVNLASFAKAFARIEKEGPTTLERTPPTRAEIEAQIKANVGNLASWAPKYNWTHADYRPPAQNSTPGMRVGVGSPRTVVATWLMARERALRGELPFTHPLLQIPYDIEPAVVVAPQINLYARLDAPNGQ